MYDFRIITSIVITDYKGSFLLGKRSMEEEVNPGLWSIVGGKVEHCADKFDILENNVKKEVMEEIGVEVSVDSYVQSHSGSKDKVYIIFVGHITKGEPLPLEDTDEVGWYRLDELDSLEMCPNVRDILRKVHNGGYKPDTRASQLPSEAKRPKRDTGALHSVGIWEK